MLTLQHRRDAIQLRSRDVDGGARCDSGVDPDVRREAIGSLIIVEHPRHPEIAGLGQVEAARHDPYHRRGASIDRQHPADDLRIATEAALPEPVVEQDDRRGAGGEVLGLEGASDIRRHAQHREKTLGYLPCLHVLGTAGSR